MRSRKNSPTLGYIYVYMCVRTHTNTHSHECIYKGRGFKHNYKNPASVFSYYFIQTSTSGMLGYLRESSVQPPTAPFFLLNVSLYLI